MGRGLACVHSPASDPQHHRAAAGGSDSRPTSAAQQLEGLSSMRSLARGPGHGRGKGHDCVCDHRNITALEPPVWPETTRPHCSCLRCPFLSFKVLIRNPETSQGVKTRPPSHLFSRWNLEFSSCPMKQPGLNLHYSKHPIEREISVREAGPTWLP